MKRLIQIINEKRNYVRNFKRCVKDLNLSLERNNTNTRYLIQFQVLRLRHEKVWMKQMLVQNPKLNLAPQSQRIRNQLRTQNHLLEKNQNQTKRKVKETIKISHRKGRKGNFKTSCRKEANKISHRKGIIEIKKIKYRARKKKTEVE